MFASQRTRLMHSMRTLPTADDYAVYSDFAANWTILLHLQ
tara:strand:- start:31808 stop:31927 length:120 start_codon:yes stop_codon:yes gene_type:complete